MNFAPFHSQPAQVPVQARVVGIAQRSPNRTTQDVNPPELTENLPRTCGKTANLREQREAGHENPDPAVRMRKGGTEHRAQKWHTEPRGGNIANPAMENASKQNDAGGGKQNGANSVKMANRGELLAKNRW